MGTTTFSGPVVSENGFSTTGSITAASAVIGGNTISGTELGYIDGVTAGTAAANKALVLNGSKGISTITSATITTLTSTTGAITTVKTGAVQAADATSAATIANSTGIVTIVGGLTMTDAKNIVVGSTTGTQIATAATQKLGFYGATAVVQQNTTGTVTGFTAGTGTAANSDSTYTGDTGSLAYTVGDVVRAMKKYGLLES